MESVQQMIPILLYRPSRSSSLIQVKTYVHYAEFPQHQHHPPSSAVLNLLNKSTNACVVLPLHRHRLAMKNCGRY
jgi:hypothetical protein